MRHEPQIRQATTEEAERLKAIGETGWETSYAAFIDRPNREKYLASDFWSVEHLRDVIECDDCCTLVADAGGIAVGFITIEPLDAGTAELTRLYVNPEYRGGGLGRALWEAALPRVRLHELRAVLVNVFGDNFSGRRFYERLGFELTEETTTVVGTQTVYDVWYRLEL